MMAEEADLPEALKARALLEAFGCRTINITDKGGAVGWQVEAGMIENTVEVVANAGLNKETPTDPVYLAGKVIERLRARQAGARDDLKAKLRRLLKEKAHAEIPRPVHDGSASAGDGAGGEPAAAADHPDPAGHGPGLASAQDQPEPQSSAANASKPAVDADFSEPSDPPEPPVDDSAGQAGLPEFDVGEADEPDFGGMVRDDRVAELSKQIDAIAKDRMAVAEAFETNSREAMEEIESKHAGGLELTEEEEQIRREFARARIAIRTLTDIATDHKKALATMSDEDLMALNPERLKWT